MARRTRARTFRPRSTAAPPQVVPPRPPPYCRFEGRLYRKDAAAVDRGYLELFEARLARFESASDS